MNRNRLLFIRRNVKNELLGWQWDITFSFLSQKNTLKYLFNKEHYMECFGTFKTITFIKNEKLTNKSQQLWTSQ
jgi:hypothetical protein